MNKIKIYTTPFTKEEFEFFEKFYRGDSFYTLTAGALYQLRIQDHLHVHRKSFDSFALFNSYHNFIFTVNEWDFKKRFIKMIKQEGIETHIKITSDYSIYEKYL